MDSYDETEEAPKKGKKPASETQAAVVPPVEGPHFYRNPDGGRLTTTKPPDAESDAE